MKRLAQALVLEVAGIVVAVVVWNIAARRGER